MSELGKRLDAHLLESSYGGGAYIHVETPAHKTATEKVVVATNAYTQQIPCTRRLQPRQYPLWTYQIVTGPLSEAQWDSISWKDRQSFGDNRQMLHYLRHTADGRIIMGGGDAIVYRTQATHEVPAPVSWDHYDAHLKWIHPQLRETRIYCRWGNSVP